MSDGRVMALPLLASIIEGESGVMFNSASTALTPCSVACATPSGVTGEHTLV